MFGIFCVAMGIFVVIFAKETKGRSLEDMDILFGAVSEADRHATVVQTMHKRGSTHIEDLEDEEAERVRNEQDKV